MGNHKATYILVHAAWHGSWCWKRVRAALQSAGHNVFTPTLTGLSERSHLNSAAVDLWKAFARKFFFGKQSVRE